MSKFMELGVKGREDLSDVYNFLKHICLKFKFNLNFLYNLDS
jgi:hypothetical protein